MSEEVKEQRYLVSIICIITIALLSFVYFHIESSGYLSVQGIEFIKNLIIEIIGSLLVLPVVFILLESRGIQLDSNVQQEVNATDVAEKIVEQLAGILPHSEGTKNVVAFYPNWRDFEWEKQLQDVKELEIIVSFWSDWVDTYRDQLTAIFDRGGKISIVLPSPLNDEALDGTSRMFPEYTPSEIKREIELTIAKLVVAFENSTAAQKQLDVKYYSGRLNYAAVRYDRNRLYYGFYEQFRDYQIGSSACLLDLTKNNVLLKFWDKEFIEFNKVCQTASLAEMTDIKNSLRANQKPTP